MNRDSITQFKEKYAALSGIPHEATDVRDLAETVLGILKEDQAKRVALGNLPPPLTEQIESVCAAADIAVIKPPYGGREMPDAIDAVTVGITRADFAVAESGSLVELTTNDAERLVSMLPRLHIGIVRGDGVLATLKDAAAPLRAFYDANPTDAVATFISGPSRTADIEMRLTLGVHGPEVAHVIIWNP